MASRCSRWLSRRLPGARRRLLSARRRVSSDRQSNPLTSLLHQHLLL
jgi:hypothetical protein